jgi:hypothetical protein
MQDQHDQFCMPMSEPTPRDIIIEWLNAPQVEDPQKVGRTTFFEVSADDLIAYLQINGFEIVALKDKP